jgi:subtilisin family serine protease
MTGRRLFCCFLFAATLALAVPSAQLHAADSIPVIVKLTSASSLTGVLNTLGGVVVDQIPGTNILLINVPNLPLVQSVLALPDFMLQLLGIDWLEINNGVTLPGRPQAGILQIGAGKPADWYKNQPAMQLIRSNEAQAYATGGSVVVADINTLVDSAHPALRGHLTSGYDFVATRPGGATALNQSDTWFINQSDTWFINQSDTWFIDQSDTWFINQYELAFLGALGLPLTSQNPAYSHGTLCAGVIAAIAPNAMIMPLRAFDDQGRSDLFMVAKAIRYAANNGANVINMSFGTLEASKALKNSVDYARGQGAILVASAGNSNTSAPQYPAAYTGVLAVAATDLTDQKASFSNYGNYIFVDGPGVRILSAYPGGYYAIVSGTSFSAPEVAATAALVRSVRTWGIASSISSTAVPIDNRNPNYVNKLGYGRIDVLRAVRPY